MYYKNVQPDGDIRAQQRDLLEGGLDDLGIELTNAQIVSTLDYLGLLRRWNQAYNLTAVKDPLEHVSRHILDSLSILPFIEGREFVDVGTGAGLPGIPLSIARPDSRWTLLDSNGKRTRFLTQCVMELGLSGIEVVQSRIEKWKCTRLPDGIVSRAFSSIGSMLALCDRIAADGSRFYAMKAELSDVERREIPATHRLINDFQLTVPGCDAKRHLLVLEKN